MVASSDKLLDEHRSNFQKAVLKYIIQFSGSTIQSSKSNPSDPESYKKQRVTVVFGSIFNMIQTVNSHSYSVVKFYINSFQQFMSMVAKDTLKLETVKS